jgi:hypothetical protein
MDRIATPDPEVRNLDPAFNPLGSKDKVSHTPKLKWYKFADQACPIAGPARKGHRRTIALLPFNRQSAALQPPPSQQQPASVPGECAVFRCIGAQLVNNHCQRLGGFTFQGYVRAAAFTSARSIRCKFTFDDRC